MELRELKTFCAVFDKRSFSKAGEVVHLSQPTVSLQIKSLESEFGVRLFDRLDRKILPTQAGEVLYQHAREILARIEQVKEELNESTGPKVSGRLILGSGVTMGETIMPSLLGSFKKEYPSVEISLRILNTSEIIRQILKHELDMGIVGEEVSHKDLTLEKFAQERLILIVGPSHPWVAKKSVSLEELSQEPILVREEGSGTRMSIRRELEKRRIYESNMNIVMELGSTGAIKQAVREGLGIAIVNQQSVRHELNTGQLVEIPIRDFTLKKEYYLVFHRKKTRSNQLKAFLQFLKNY